MKGLPLFVVILFAGLAQATVIPSEKEHVISLDGTWRFKLEQAKGEYDGPSRQRPRPQPDYPEQPAEPFYKTDYQEVEGWHDIRVPSNWEMSGHSPSTYNQPDNASGFYRLSFDVPRNWEGRMVKINFDAVVG